jgi:hypothetical protein
MGRYQRSVLHHGHGFRADPGSGQYRKNPPVARPAVVGPAQTGRALLEQLLQGDAQAIRHEGDEGVRLDPLFVLMVDRADRQIPLQILERRSTSDNRR